MSERYKNYIRSLKCLVYEDFGYECIGETVCHHVKTRGSGGEDLGNLIPICHYHHSKIHSTGRLTFQKEYNTNFKLMAFEIYSDFNMRGSNEKDGI